MVAAGSASDLGGERPRDEQRRLLGRLPISGHRHGGLGRALAGRDLPGQADDLGLHGLHAGRSGDAHHRQVEQALPAVRAAEKPEGISSAAVTLPSSTAFSASSAVIVSVFTTPEP